MKLLRALDCILYLVSQIGIFVAAANGSLIWVCFFGFCLIDEGLTILSWRITKGEDIDA